MLIIASTCGVTNRQTQLTFKVLTTWQHPREGGVFGPVLWTNWEHWASMSTKLPPHWAETLWSPKNRAPTASNHAKASAWVLVLAISLGRCILYLKVWFWVLVVACMIEFIYIYREGGRESGLGGDRSFSYHFLTGSCLFAVSRLYEYRS